MKYLTFELSVDAREAGAFDVRCRSPAGDPRGRMALPFSGDEVAAHHKALEGAIALSSAVRSITQSNAALTSAVRLARAEAIGTTLFNALLSGDVQTAYRISLGIAAREEAGLRLQLRLRPPEIAALPWEFMYDPVVGSFVSLNPSTPIARYPELDQTLRALAINTPLRILGMMASPQDLPPLDKEAEVKRIEGSLGELRGKRQVELEWVKGGSFGALQTALSRGSWHIFHFIGHGKVYTGARDGTGVLGFELVEGTGTHEVSARHLGDLLRGYPSLRLVVLNSCLGARASEADAFSSVAGALVKRTIPAVLAMQYQLSDRAAIAFAERFYTSLAAGAPVDRAVADARVHMNAQQEDSLEWGTPLLLMRSPDGILFTPSSAPPVVEPPGKPVPPLPVRRPLNFKLVLGAVLIPLLLAAVLAVWHRPQAGMTLDAQVTGVEFVLSEDFTVFSPLPVMRLGVSGLRSISLSYPSGRRTFKTNAVLLSAIKDSAERSEVSLDLATPMPKGSRMWLELGDQRGKYVIKTDSLDGATMPMTGPVQVVVPDSLNQRVDFGPSGTVGLESRGRLLRFDFTLDSASQSPLTDRVPLSGLSFTRIDQYMSGGLTDLREVSTIRAGTLAIEGAKERRLLSAQPLRVSAVRGEITRLDLARDHLQLQLRAQVRGLSTGPDSAAESLMPSVLCWTLAAHPWRLVGGLLIYLALLALALHLRPPGPA